MFENLLHPTLLARVLSGVAALGVTLAAAAVGVRVLRAARFAAGRPGVLVIEATGIRDVPSGPLLRIGDDRFVPGLRALVDAVRAASGGQTLLFIQLIDFLMIRRRPPRDAYLGRHLAITARHRAALGLASDARDVPEAAVRAALAALPEAALLAILDEREREDLTLGYRERVTDTHLPHIAALPAVLPGLFAAAAARAAVAGFDGVELHFAHAYTMASFLSARNTRADGYGGDRAGRLRLPREVIAATRAAVPASTVVGCRMLGDEVIAGGTTAAEAPALAVALAEAGLDFVDEDIEFVGKPETLTRLTGAVAQLTNLRRQLDTRGYLSTPGYQRRIPETIADGQRSQHEHAAGMGRRCVRG